MLATAGADKITFVGGEPTLCPYLGDLLAASKDVGLTTCIVTNASGLTEEFLDEWGHLIDWIGLSIDASNDEIHTVIGRGMRGDLARARSHHLELAKDAWKRCKSRGIRMKLNTVVCKPNLDDDMTKLVLELMPERWKIFEVLPVEGQNDGDVEELLLDNGEFQSWVDRHSFVEDYGIQFVPESNELMRGSYAMLDALGRFYSNAGGGHEYGPSILDVGVLEAWEQNVFIEERFNCGVEFMTGRMTISNFQWHPRRRLDENKHHRFIRASCLWQEHYSKTLRSTTWLPPESHLLMHYIYRLNL